jgi:hypothetical protein
MSARHDRILKANKNRVNAVDKKPLFYALVDVRTDDGIKTIVIDGNSRRDAEKNALTEIKVNNWKAKISGVYPVVV